MNKKMIDDLKRWMNEKAPITKRLTVLEMDKTIKKQSDEISRLKSTLTEEEHHKFIELERYIDQLEQSKEMLKFTVDGQKVKLNDFVDLVNEIRMVIDSPITNFEELHNAITYILKQN